MNEPLSYILKWHIPTCCDHLESEAVGRFYADYVKNHLGNSKDYGILESIAIAQNDNYSEYSTIAKSEFWRSIALSLGRNSK